MAWKVYKAKYVWYEPDTLIKKLVIDHIDEKKYKVFLFGSRVANNDPRSDFDVWIIWENKLPMKTYLDLLSKIRELPRKVDLVDFCRVDKKFKDLVFKWKIIRWN